jgi:hypothetical protein
MSFTERQRFKESYCVLIKDAGSTKLSEDVRARPEVSAILVRIEQVVVEEVQSIND